VLELNVHQSVILFFSWDTDTAHFFATTTDALWPVFLIERVELKTEVNAVFRDIYYLEAV
jgi:hypothetical protein